VEGAGLYEVVIVLGHRSDDVARAIRTSIGTRTVANPDYLRGQATSLRAGLEAMSEDSEAAVLILGDQPAVDAPKVRAIVASYTQSEVPVVQATYGGMPGHPVLFDRSIWADLMAIDGDRGARDVLRQHPEWIRTVELGGEVPADLDTWEDYERLKELWAAR
jgi:molybdenum cofactor cytidylyltransferase